MVASQFGVAEAEGTFGIVTRKVWVCLSKPGSGLAILIVVLITTLSLLPECWQVDDQTEPLRTYKRSCANHIWDSKAACEAMRNDFPRFEEARNLALLVRKRDGTTVPGHETEQLLRSFAAHFHGRTCYIGTEAYYDQPQEFVAKYLSSDGTATVLILKLNVASSDYGHCVDIAHKYSEQYSMSYTDYELTCTGWAAAEYKLEQDSHPPWWYLMMLALPVALLILWLLVGSWRLMLIPVAVAAASYIISMGWAYFLADYGIPVQKNILRLVRFFVFAITLNSQLFFLTRWQEERRAVGLDEAKNPETQLKLIQSMMQFAGSIVVLSALVQMVGFAGLIFFPQMIRSFGIVMLPTVTSCVLVSSLTMPGMLLSFPRFFNLAGLPLEWRQIVSSIRRDAQGDEAAPSEETPLVRSSAVSSEEETSTPGPYFHLTMAITQKPWAFMLPIIILGLLAWAVVPVADIKVYLAVSMPTQDEQAIEAKAYRSALQDFKSGVVQNPFGIVIRAPKDTSLQDQHFYRDLCKIIMEVRKVPNIALDNIYSVAWNRTSQECMLYNPEVVQAMPHYVNAKKSSTLISVVSTTDTTGRDVSQLIHDLRDALDRAKMRIMKYFTPPEIHLYSQSVSELDELEYSKQVFPFVLIGSTLVVCGLIAWEYGSFFAIFVMTITIALPIFATIGLAIQVYQHGSMDWTSSDSLNATGGLQWDVPLFCGIVLFSLTADYGISLLSRICEARSHILDDRRAIATAADAISHVINAAGIVMIIGFMGLLLVRNSICNQAGFILVVGIAIDTILMKVFTVPCLLSLVPSINYWPATMPDEAYFAVETEVPAGRKLANTFCDAEDDKAKWALLQDLTPEQEADMFDNMSTPERQQMLRVFHEQEMPERTDAFVVLFKALGVQGRRAMMNEMDAPTKAAMFDRFGKELQKDMLQSMSPHEQAEMFTQAKPTPFVDSSDLEGRHDTKDSQPSAEGEKDSKKGGFCKPCAIM